MKPAHHQTNSNEQAGDDQRIAHIIEDEAQFISAEYGLNKTRIRAILERTARIQGQGKPNYPDYLFGTVTHQNDDVPPGGVYFSPSLKLTLQSLRKRKSPSPEEILRFFESFKVFTQIDSDGYTVVTDKIDPNREYEIATDFEPLWLLWTKENDIAVLKKYEKILYSHDLLARQLDDFREYINRPANLNQIKTRGSLKPTLFGDESDDGDETKRWPWLYERLASLYPPFDGITKEQNLRLLQIRPKLLHLKLKLLETMALAIRGQRNVVKDSLDIIANLVQPNDIEECLKLDHTYIQLSIDEYLEAKLIRAGGITDMLEVIYGYSQLQRVSNDLMADESQLHKFLEYDDNNVPYFPFRSYVEFLFKYPPEQREAFDRGIHSVVSHRHGLPQNMDLYEESECEQRTDYFYEANETLFGILTYPKVDKLETKFEFSEDVFGRLHGDCIFRQDGDFWTISYGGKLIPLEDMKGLHYIRHLLQNRNRVFTIEQLFALVEKSTKEKPGDTSVTTPVGRALNSLSKRHPTLRVHLRRYLHVGKTSYYSPPRNMNWQL